MNFEDLITQAYAAFNARDIDAVLAVMQPDVDWPNGWEGGRVIGRDEVRKYWTRQWKAIDPTVTPERFVAEGDGRITVHVHQIVRDLDGNAELAGSVQKAGATATFQPGCLHRPSGNSATVYCFSFNGRNAFHLKVPTSYLASSKTLWRPKNE